MTRQRSVRDDRVWQAGFLVGSARRCGDRGRLPHGALRRRGLVDWPAAERAAIGCAMRPDGCRRPSSPPPRAPTPRRWLASPRLSEALGTDLPGVVARSGVATGPAGCANWPASLRSSGVRGRCSTRSCRRRRIGQASIALANRWIDPIGFTFGFMATRVSADPALLSADDFGSAPVRRGNIRQTASSLACRSTRSDLDRPPRDDPRSSSRRIRGSGRTSPTGSSASSPRSAGGRKACPRRWSGASAERSGARRRASTGWSG